MAKQNFTKEEILTGRISRVVQPRPVPHGYQVEQWERHEQILERLRIEQPDLDVPSFMQGWNAAFNEIYSRKSK